MRIMTWNVQGRMGDWEARHVALRSWIERTAPDVLTLQESWVEPDGTTQAARLAQELGLHTVTAAELAGFDRYPQAPYWVVNAVLSRWPLTIERLCPLPDENGEPTWRHVLVTRVHRPADEGEVVCANIAGKIDLAAIARLGETFEIPGLDQVDED